MKVETHDVAKYLDELDFSADQISKIISLYEVRLRYIAKLKSPKDFATQLDLHMKQFLTPLHDFITLNGASERSKIVKAIDARAANGHGNGTKVRLLDLPESSQNADAINEVLYLYLESDGFVVASVTVPLSLSKQFQITLQ